jgi:hypothetical protein
MMGSMTTPQSPYRSASELLDAEFAGQMIDGQGRLVAEMNARLAQAGFPEKVQGFDDNRPVLSRCLPHICRYLGWWFVSARSDSRALFVAAVDWCDRMNGVRRDGRLG